MSLPSDQETPGLIPDSTLGFLSNGREFHGISAMAVCVFQCAFSMFYSGFSSADHRSGEVFELCPVPGCVRTTISVSVF